MPDPYAGFPHWFGTEPSWCPATDDGTHVETPTGELCLHCEEPIGEDDCGYLMPYVGLDGNRVVPLHRACDFRMKMGGAECIRRHFLDAHTVGDHEPDPPGMSTREAAQAAWNAFHEIRGLAP
jgi:hypothetical protein